MSLSKSDANVKATEIILLCSNARNDFSGGDRRGETPVPIPNTEVKPSTGDGTIRAVLWESSKLPGFFIKKPHVKTWGFFIK